MSRFIDHHPTAHSLSPEVQVQLLERLRTGERDGFGERGLKVFVGERLTFCYTDAPSADAVRRSHAAFGIELGPDDVTEVEVLP